MAGHVFLIALALGAGPAPKEVSDADKQAFFKLLAGLEFQPAGHAAIFTEKSVKRAAPFAPVLFALTEKDLHKKEFTPFLLLTLQLAEIDEARLYGVKNFARIAHPRIKLFWANALFQARQPPICSSYAMASSERTKRSTTSTAQCSRNSKERVIWPTRSPSSRRWGWSETLQEDGFQTGGFSYTAANCVFAPGPAVRSPARQRWLQAGQRKRGSCSPGCPQEHNEPTFDSAHQAGPRNLVIQRPLLSISARRPLVPLDHPGQRRPWLPFTKAADSLRETCQGSVHSVRRSVVADRRRLVPDHGAGIAASSRRGRCAELRGSEMTSAAFGSFGMSMPFIAKTFSIWPGDCLGRLPRKQAKMAAPRELHRPEPAGAQGGGNQLEMARSTIYGRWMEERITSSSRACIARPSQTQPLKVCARIIGPLPTARSSSATALSSPAGVLHVIHPALMGAGSEIAIEQAGLRRLGDSIQLHAEADRSGSLTPWSRTPCSSCGCGQKR